MPGRAGVKMDQLWAVLVPLGLYLGPQLAPSGRWLALLAAGGAVLAVIVWFAWVEQQTSSIGSGVAALLVLLGAGTAALGVAVRAVVLWRGWQGGQMTLAVLGGAGLWVAGLFLLFQQT